MTDLRTTHTGLDPDGLLDSGGPASPPTVAVSRRETFNAAHKLSNPELSPEENERLFGKCANLHGHNYTLEVVVTGEIDPRSGYVKDLKSLSELMKREIIADVDHRNLNVDVAWLADQIPTAEVLARAFFQRLDRHLPEGALQSVRLWETEKNWAECRRNDGG